ncbi:MAG: IscS subfamily cysteine desulfurase, partial [Deltaproteobacteria bacterium]|nr:IscS subfamily cysteine desulfurase [Deltaproteobacteria bacterium]
MKIPVYMDNNATTPVDPKVLEAMLPYFTEKFGNAASRNHSFGWEAEAAVDEAREQIARLIRSASPKEIIFTSGATESDNLAIKGVAEFYQEKGNHIITCVTEHKAVLDSCKALERQGYKVTYLPVDSFGLVDVGELRTAITDKTVLISIMAANNEIGTIQPVKEIGLVAKERGIFFHCDATQAVGKIPVDVEEAGIDLLSMSAHKFYGPKGVGALYVRSKKPRVRLCPIIDGGGHERGMRSGTLNVAGIVGLGKACQIALQELPVEAARLTRLKERLKDGIFLKLDEVYVNGHPTQRLAGNLNVSFAYVEGESLLMGRKELAVSSGSACTSAGLEPSYVRRALG